MMLNDTICLMNAKPSGLDVLNIDGWQAVGLTIGIGVIAIIGFIARGLFIYFLTYEAPKDRPINVLMFEEQVRHI